MLCKRMLHCCLQRLIKPEFWFTCFSFLSICIFHHNKLGDFPHFTGKHLFQISRYLSHFCPSQQTDTIGNDLSHTLVDLFPNTYYEVRVRSKPFVDNWSDWSAKTVFKTLGSSKFFEFFFCLFAS